MRLPLLLVASVLLVPGCAPDRGCLHGDLDDWCKHDESEPGPVNPDGADCEVDCVYGQSSGDVPACDAESAP